MKITRLETFLTNSGLRNYLFVRLSTDTGLTGLGEASLEWQELTVQTLIHEWVEDRILGADPSDVEAAIGHGPGDLVRVGPGVVVAAVELVNELVGLGGLDDPVDLLEHLPRPSPFGIRSKAFPGVLGMMGSMENLSAAPTVYLGAIEYHLTGTCPGGVFPARGRFGDRFC